MDGISLATTEDDKEGLREGNTDGLSDSDGSAVGLPEPVEFTDG